MAPRLSFVLVFTLVAGCYTPAIGPCELRCAPDMRCPDGLVCNPEGRCAISENALCGPTGEPTTITILVEDERGAPASGAVVVFADASGAQLAELTTADDGIATLEMEPGGSATVIRTLVQSPSTRVQVSTYLDLWRDARIVSRHEREPSDRTITVVFELQAGVSSYQLHTSCDPRVAVITPATSPVSVPVLVAGHCKAPDIVISAANPGGPPTRAAVILAAVDDVYSVPNSDWIAPQQYPVTIAGFPTTGVTGDASASGWITQPHFNGSAMATTPIASGGNTMGWYLPQGMGATAQLQLQNTINPTKTPQLVYERLPRGFAAFAPDLAGRLLPWSSAPVIDPATRQLTWSVQPVGALPLVAPSIVVVGLGYQRDALLVTWQIVGLGSGIAATDATQRMFTLPDIPGDRPFELVTNTSISASSLAQILVAAPLVDQVRARFGSPAGIELFEIAELRGLTVTTADGATPVPVTP